METFQLRYVWNSVSDERGWLYPVDISYKFSHTLTMCPTHCTPRYLVKGENMNNLENKS